VSPNDLPPEPMVEPEVDLRDFAFMPLDVVRLRDSGLTAKATGDEFRAAVLLWCASWHQIPAASLPDDDQELANLCGYARAMREWSKVKAGALRGWIKCSDGRLYHPIVAEKAADAWAKKQAQRARTEAARRAREEERQRKSQGQLQPLLQSPGLSVTDIVTGSKGQGQGQGQGQGDLNTRSHLTQGRGDPPKPVRSPTGSRLAPDWTLPEDLKAWATEARPDLDIALQAARFRDYWAALPGAKGRKTDWPATWRNWIRGEKLAPGTYARPAYDYEAIARAAGLTDDDEEHAHATD